MHNLPSMLVPNLYTRADRCRMQATGSAAPAPQVEGGINRSLCLLAVHATLTWLPG